MFTIYKASAGSGKTSRLVSEYLTLTIPSPEKFKRVLAITFTNNATAEMKERIVNTLYSFAFEEVSKFDGSTQAIYNAVVNNFKATSNPYEHPYIQAQSQKLLREILYNYDQFSISTIDTFFQKILRAFAFDLGINMNYNVQIQLDELHNQAISLLISKLTDTNQELTQRLTQLINSSMEESGKWDIEKQLLQLLNNIFNEDAFQALQAIGELDKDEINSANKQFLDKKREAYRQFQNLKVSVEIQAEESGIKIAGIIKEFSKENLKPGELKSKIENFESPSNIQDQLFALHALHQHIKTIHFLSSNLSKLALLNDMQEIIEEIKKEENLFYLSDTNRLIHSEIKDEEAPYIYEKIGNKYSYFFIDEFQDTSLLQWENLVPLLINALAGDKFGEMGKVAIFGDLKQAIYRFRNGDPELLKQLSQPKTFSKALKSNVLNSSQVNNVHLGTNYRSTPSIIQFNNKFFDYWVQSGGMQELIEYYSEVEQKTNQNKDPGLVSIQFKTEDDERDNTSYLIEETLQTILQLRKEGVPFGDIAVLMSGNSTLSDLGLLLSKNEIPIISSESLTLSSSTWVMLLSSAVEWIANPDLPYYRMMVAHYFLRSNDQTADNLYDVIQNHDSFLGFLNNRGVTIHPDQLRMMHLNRIIYELLKTFKISKRDPYIVAFLDEVEQHFSSGTGSLFEFITWWTENKPELKLSSSTSVDAVTLSTIHKAKGLAYKVVIFAFSQYGYQYTKKDQWIPTDPNITSLPYSWVTLKEATLPDQYIDLLNEEKKLTSLDNLNKIYVAHTRAKQRLYIITVGKTGRGNYSKVLWNFIENGISEEQKESHQFWTQDGTQFVTEDPVQLKDLVEENDPLEKEEAKLHLSDFKVDNRFLVLEKPKVLTEEQEKGVYIHQFLASLTSLPRNSEERGEVLAGVPPHFLPPLISILKKINEDIEYQSLLDPEIPAWNEVNLITDSGKILRPDRIVFFQDKTVVMDYKTGKPEQEHQAQIDLYCEQLTAMGYPNVMGKLIYL